MVPKAITKTLRIVRFFSLLVQKMFIVHCEITRMIKEWHFRWKIWQMWWWRQRRGAVPSWRLLVQKSIFGGGYHGRIWTRVRTHWLIGMLSRKNKGKIFYFDDEKSSFAAMVIWNKTQINLLSQNGRIESIYYHVQIQVFIQTFRYL